MDPCIELLNAIKGLPHDVLQDLNFTVKKNIRQYPPAKNRNKMTYGGINELAIVNLIKKVCDVRHLDNDHSVGSEYKNDIVAFGTKFSVKASKNLGSELTLINKRNKDTHSISDVNMIVIFGDKGIIAVFPMSAITESCIKNSGSSIGLKGSYYNMCIKNTHYEFSLPELSAEQLTVLEGLKEIDHIQEAYDRLVALR